MILGNGLRLRFLPKLQYRLVSIVLVIHTGSGVENEELCGLAHFLEHLVFKGSNESGHFCFPDRIEQLGGDICGQTSWNYTLLRITIHSKHLGVVLGELSRLLQFFHRYESSLEEEKNVVYQELAFRSDDLEWVLRHRLYAITWPGHPYSRPILGTKETIRQFTSKQVKTFFLDWYRPSNATLFIVGDFQENTVLDEVSFRFGGWVAASQKPKPVWPLMISCSERAEVMFSASRPMTEIGFPIVGKKDRSFTAFSILRYAILRRSNRLYSKGWLGIELVGGEDAGLVVLHLAGEGLENQDRGGALDRIRELLSTPLCDDEISRAVSCYRLRRRRELENLEQIVPFLLDAQMVGSNLNVESVWDESITLSNSEIAKCMSFLDLRNANIVVTGGAPTRKFYAQDKRLSVECCQTKIMPSESNQNTGFPAVYILSDTEGREKKSDTRRFLLDCGATLLGRNTSHSETVAVVASLGGIPTLSHELNGISSVLIRLWGRGTSLRSQSAFNAWLTNAGATIHGNLGQDSLSLSAVFHREHWRQGLKVFFELLRMPSLTENHLCFIKKQLGESIKESHQPAKKAQKQIRKALFVKHPYSQDIMDYQDIIADISRAQLVDFYSKVAVGRNLVIAITGNLDLDELVRLAEEELSGMNPGSRLALNVACTPPSFSGPTCYRLQTVGEQSHVAVGFTGVALSSGTKYPLHIAWSILEGVGGVLYKELRIKRSLTYQLTAFSREFALGGYVMAYAGCEEKHRSEALDVLQNEFLRLSRYHVNSAEIIRAKDRLICTHLRAYDNSLIWANAVAKYELLCDRYENLDTYIDRLNTTSTDEVIDTAERLFRCEHMVTVELSPM